MEDWKVTMIAAAIAAFCVIVIVLALQTIRTTGHICFLSWTGSLKNYIPKTLSCSGSITFRMKHSAKQRTTQV